MKKMYVAMVAVAMVFGMLSCSSTKALDDDKTGGAKISKEQAAINESFGKVYDSYANILVLDGATAYEVKEGDTLTSIAKKSYGDDNGYYFPIIMLASRNVIKDPELIEPGMKLTIPSFDANIKNKEVAKKLSPYFKDIAGVYEQKHSAKSEDIRPNLLTIADTLAAEEPAAATDAAAPAGDAAATESAEAAPAAESSDTPVVQAEAAE